MRTITLVQACVERESYVDIMFAYLEYTIPLCLVCFFAWAALFWKKTPGSKVRIAFFLLNIVLNVFLKLLLSTSRPSSGCGFGPPMPSFRAQIGCFFFLHICMLNGWKKRVTTLCSCAFSAGILGSIVTRSVGASEVVVGIIIGSVVYLVSIAAHYGQFDPFIRRIDLISRNLATSGVRNLSIEEADSVQQDEYCRDVNA